MRKLLFGAIAAAAIYGTSNAYAQEREWALDAVDEDVFLTFGVPNTDDVAVSFWCPIGSNKPKFFANINSNNQSKPNLEAQIIIAKQTFKLPMVASSKGRPTVETASALPSPIVQALASEDRFAFDFDGHHSVFPLEGADIQGFTKLCQTAP